MDELDYRIEEEKEKLYKILKELKTEESYMSSTLILEKSLELDRLICEYYVRKMPDQKY